MLFRSFFHSAQKIFINSGVGIWNNGGIAGFLIEFHRANAANDGIAVPVFPHGSQTAQQQGNTSNATNALTEVNPEVLSVDAKAVYDTIYKSMQSSMFQELSQSGVNAFDDANYTEAIDKLSKAKNINDSDYTVLNYLAHAYRLSGDTDNAISVFQEIIDKFPGTQKATKAEQQIEALGGTVKTEE